MYKCFLVTGFLCFLFSAFSQKITLTNSSTKSARKGYFNWTVFVNADETALNSIDHVEYLLDPSFRVPQVNSADRNSKFGYKATGWGEFSIKGKVYFKDKKKTPMDLTYWLSLSKK